MVNHREAFIQISSRNNRGLKKHGWSKSGVIPLRQERVKELIKTIKLK